MHTMQSTLLVGPADWDPARMPKEEFLARATALWRTARAASSAIVYGDRAHHAELAYLTGFTPKLEAALALIPRVGTPRLLVGGGANMLQAAKPLTWIENLVPLRKAGEMVTQWAREQSGGGRPVLIAGARMPPPLRREVDAATGRIADKTGDLHALMRRKSARELAAVRAACTTLDMAIAAMVNAHRLRKSATDTILAGELAAHERGAQDVRTLFSPDAGRTLRPFEAPVERALDPLQVYVAVRQQGYWAEGFALLSTSPVARVTRAAEVLAAVLAMIEPGKPCAEAARAIARGIGLLRPHPVTAQVQGNALGLALEEHPLITAASKDTFEAGDVYSLRVGIADGHEGAIVSAMVAVGETGSDVLWPPEQ